MLEFIKNGKGEILNLFFKNPDGVYYLREIAKKLNKEPAYYQRYLDALVADDILQDERKGNLRFFKLNKNHPLYEELKKIIFKTIGLEGQIKGIINSLDGVEVAFIFGSIAKEKENIHSDIDLMLIGVVDQNRLIEAVNKVEEELSREINYHIFTREEILEKIKTKDSFFINVFSGPKIILKGNLNEYTIAS